MKRLGPLVTLSLSCVGCEYERAAIIVGVSCAAPTIVEADGVPRRIIGATSGTPTWCPLRASAIARVAEEDRP